MVIPPWLSYSCNFINGTDSKLGTGADDLFPGTGYSVMSHSLHTIYARFKSIFSPLHCDRLLFVTYSFLLTKPCVIEFGILKCVHAVY